MTTILIVDDNRMDQLVARGFCEQAGVQTRLAGDGREALSMIESVAPDIVLTDMVMPEMNGLELVKELHRSRPSLPVILMTSQGSEELAVAALHSGAANYLPKRSLKQDLEEVLKTVIASMRSHAERDLVLNCMTSTESCFEIGYDPASKSALVKYCQDALRMMNLCNESDLLRVGTALSEALTNAIEHGNLELSSKLREEADAMLYHELGRQRSQRDPYARRRVHFSASLTNQEARWSIRDDGPGFDPATLPDPHDPENLMRPHGRGLMLIRTFMDDVSFNEAGNEIILVKSAKAP